MKRETYKVSNFEFSSFSTETKMAREDFVTTRGRKVSFEKALEQLEEMVRKGQVTGEKTDKVLKVLKKLGLDTSGNRGVGADFQRIRKLMGRVVKEVAADKAAELKVAIAAAMEKLEAEKKEAEERAAALQAQTEADPEDEPIPIDERNLHLFVSGLIFGQLLFH